LALDRIAVDRDLLIVKSAGNTGAGSAQITSPGDFLNGITVGATDSSMHARARFSAYHLAGDTGAAPDLGHKPEILAPGTAIISQSISAAGDTSGTSFAAPHVAGAASLLAKGTETTPGLPLGTTVDNHLAVKAILLNSTRKRYISEPENSEQMAEDFGGTANEDSDFNYLNDDGSLRFVKNFKTAEWTPSSWEIVAPGGAQPFFSTNRPLDDEQGTGLLDAERALIQLDGGEQAPGPVSKIGWHRGVLSPGGEVDYMLNTLIPKGAFITATLVWDRIVDVTESDGSPSDNVFESTDIYAAGALPDFDLELLFQGEKIAESVAVDGTLEHLHIPAVDFGEVLDYTLRVKLFSLEASSYSLAWWTVPEPSCAGLLAIAVFAAGWRRNEIIGRG
jgi:subtilisin family serine protease